MSIEQLNCDVAVRNQEKEIERLQKYEKLVWYIANDYHELSHDKAKWQRDDWKNRCRKLIEEDNAAIRGGREMIDLVKALRNRAAWVTATGITEPHEHIDWMAADEITRLREEVVRLRETLEFYADSKNYSEIETAIGMLDGMSERDCCGRRAREALGIEE